MSRVGIDLDGVCYDFADSVRTYLDAAGRIAYADCGDPHRWEFYEDWGLTLADFLAACHAGVDEGVIFTHGAPHPGTHEAFHRLKADGHTIHVVTDRSFGKQGASVAATAAWLARHDLPYDSLTFTADKTVVHLDAMVDDKPSNADALDAAGVPVWIFDRPWNRGHRPDLPRVSTLPEYAEVVR